MLSAAATRDKRKLLAASAVFTLLAAGLVLYVSVYADWIIKTTAVPTYDQYGYVVKTFAIAVRASKGFWHAINPLTYLSEPYANRPPLMLAAAAWVFGPTFNYAAIAMLWFIMRMAGLFLIFLFLARKIRNGWWIPAAALAIFSAPGWLRVYPNILIMDQPFEVGVLVAFVAAVWDLHTRTWQSALFAVIGFFIAVLIKAAAPILFLPWLGFLIGQLLYKKLRGLRLGIYLAGLALLIALALSPLGRAVVDQYRDGMKGWWAFPLSWHEKLAQIFLIFPWWLMAAVMIAALMRGRRNNSVVKPESVFPDTRWIWIPAIVLAVWWFIFNAFISYTMDVRIVPAAMPVVIVAACVWLTPTWRHALVTTSLSAVVFAASLLIAVGRVPPTPAIPWITAQKPIAEVGLHDIASALRQTVPQESSVLINVDDHFVETFSISLVWFQLAPGQMPRIASPLPGIVPHLATKMSGFDFILLKKKNSTSELAGNAWASLHAVEDLIRMPESPVYSYYEPVWTLPTHQPGYDDEVTLYRRRDGIPQDVLIAADAFADQRMKAERVTTHAK